MAGEAEIRLQAYCTSMSREEHLTQDAFLCDALAYAKGQGMSEEEARRVILEWAKRVMEAQSD